MHEQTVLDLLKTTQAIDDIASSLTMNDTSSIRNQVSKFAILVPAHNAFCLKETGKISDEEYRAIFDTCWKIVADRSGCSQDLVISERLIDIFTTLGMVPEGYVFDRMGGGLGRWF